MPDGIFANTLNLCNHLEKIQIYTNGITCKVVSSWFASSVGLSEEELTLILKSIYFPYGNTNALGSFEECIAAKSDLKDSMNPPFEIPDFKGSYVPLKLVSAQSEVRKDHNERMAGRISIIGGSLPISLENVSVLKKSVDPQLKQNYSIGIGVNHCWIYNWTCQFAICYVCA